MIYYITSCSLRVVQISTCVGLQALTQANTKFSRGLRYTGVGGTFCGRSEMILRVGNLQKGERCVCSLLYGYAALTISLGIRTWISLLVPPCTPSSSLSSSSAMTLRVSGSSTCSNGWISIGQTASKYPPQQSSYLRFRNYTNPCMHRQITKSFPSTSSQA